MNENNKKYIIILSIYIVVTYLIGLILVLATHNTDLLGISSIIATLLLLLYINWRSSRNKTIKFKKEYYTKKKEKDSEEYKSQQKILWIFFLVLVVLSIISCLINF